MSDLFQQHEQDFAELSAQITGKIATNVKRTTGDEKRKHVRSVEQDLGELEELIDQMELEVRSIPQQQRAKMQTMVSNYKNEFQNLKKELRKAEITVGSDDSNRQMLFDNNNMEMDEMIGDDQRQLLQRNTDTLNRTSRRLRDTQREVLEIEEVGIEILSNLNEQGQTLTRARNRLDETDAELRKSSRIAINMYRHIIQNKFIFAGIALILLACIVMIIYFKFVR